MLSFVPSLALLPIRTRPYRPPTGEPGEMDGRLNVSRKWQAPLGSGPGFLLLCLLLWDVALESGPHVFPSVCCGSQKWGQRPRAGQQDLHSCLCPCAHPGEMVLPGGQHARGGHVHVLLSRCSRAISDVGTWRTLRAGAPSFRGFFPFVGER